MSTRMGQLLARRDAGELTPDEAHELNELLAGELIQARPTGLFWNFDLDLDEVANELNPVAFDMVDDLDPRIREGAGVSKAYYEGQAYTALNTLVSIALLPSARG